MSSGIRCMDVGSEVLREDHLLATLKALLRAAPTNGLLALLAMAGSHSSFPFLSARLHSNDHSIL